MAARRLLIVMLALLALSTLAAALVPPQGQRADTSSTGTTAESERTPKKPAPSGRLSEQAIDASSREPQTIRMRRGDELALTVRSGAPDQVEIPAFGRIEDVGRDDPARFDLLAERTGTFEVRLVEAGRVIGRISVRPAS